MWYFFRGWPLTFSFIGFAAYQLRLRDRAMTLLFLATALLTLVDEAEGIVWLERLLLILGSLVGGLGIFLQWRARRAAREAAGQ